MQSIPREVEQRVKELEETMKMKKDTLWAARR